MEQRIYHGKITPSDFARSLISNFNRGNYQVQQIGSGPHLAVQIATRNAPSPGGQTALSVDIQQVADGVSVQISKQEWMGVAASLGFSALAALMNPVNLLGRLDDIAQDIQSLQLSDEVWKVVDAAAQAEGAGFELSERLRRIVCEYCSSANPVGESNCVSCGAPLGGVQPRTCRRCGFVITTNESICPNCKQPLKI
jgi:hypothetical protein